MHYFLRMLPRVGTVCLLLISFIFGKDTPLFIGYTVFISAFVYALHKHRVERYHTERSFTLWFQLLIGIGLLLFFLSVFSIFGFPSIKDPLLFLSLLLGVLVIQFFPYVWVRFYLMTHSHVDSSMLTKLKRYDPVHPLFQQLWKTSPSPHIQSLLIRLEHHCITFPDRVHQILLLWMQLGLISPLSFFPPAQRHLYLYMRTQQEHTVRIHNIQESPTALLFSLECHGNFTGDDLLLARSKGKLYEYFSHTTHPLRSLYFDSKRSELHLEFYNSFPEEEKDIIHLAEKIELAFTELEVRTINHQYPSFKSYTIMDEEIKGGMRTIYTVRMRYILPPGLSTELFTPQKIAQIASYVRLPFYKHRLKPHEDTVDFFIEIHPRNTSSLSYKDFPKAEKLRIPLGFDLIWRRPVFINLEQENMQSIDPGFTPHLIIGGATASGKSNFIKFFITSLLRSHTPESLRLFLVDPKVVSFNIFKDSPHLYAPIVSDAQKFKTVLSGIIDEVERRYSILAKYGVENIPQLEKKHPHAMKDLPRILVIVDEFADIIDAHTWKIREDINLMLKRLGQKARAAGVHLVLITQRATSTNIDGEIKANLSGRIAFRMASEGDSQVLISDGLAAHIERTGEGYAQLGEASELVHFQAPHIDESDIRAVLSLHSHIPQKFINKALSEELIKTPLKSTDVHSKRLPVGEFPSIPVGIDLESHKPISLFLGSVNRMSDIEPTPHLVIAGATNAGKSQFAKLLVYKMIQEATPDELRLILIDPKAVTFVPFKQAPHLACPIITEHRLLLPLLRNCLEEIEFRYKLFAEYEVENVEVFRMRTGKRMPSIVLIIDEFADLLDFFPFKERDEIEKILKRYGQMARAAGVHLVLITQRATSQNIPSELRANLSGKIALRMFSEADSHYLLEEAGAEKIKEPGVFLLKRGSHAPIKGYSPLIHKEDIETLIHLATKTFGPAVYEPRLEEILSNIQIDHIITETKAGLREHGFFNVGKY